MRTYIFSVDFSQIEGQTLKSGALASTDYVRLPAGCSLPQLKSLTWTPLPLGSGAEGEDYDEVATGTMNHAQIRSPAWPNAPKNKNKRSAMAHPYEDQEATDLWKLLDRCIQQLEENSDLKLQTDRRYVVGYLCQQLTERPCNHG